jgi:hypothetical protein
MDLDLITDEAITVLRIETFLTLPNLGIQSASVCPITTGHLPSNVA